MCLTCKGYSQSDVFSGLLARKAVEAGLSVKPYIKTSLSPGSGVVTYYLKESGVTPFLEKLGYVDFGITFVRKRIWSLRKTYF